MTKQLPVFQTARLTVRPRSIDDLDACLDMGGDREVARFAIRIRPAWATGPDASPAGFASVSMARIKLTQTWKSHVAAARRLHPLVSGRRMKVIRRLPGLPVERALGVFSGRRKAVTLYVLLGGPKRACELEIRIAGISQKVLIEQLRAA
jgi:hypothetical protein